MANVGNRQWIQSFALHKITPRHSIDGKIDLSMKRRPKLAVGGACGSAKQQQAIHEMTCKRTSTLAQGRVCLALLVLAVNVLEASSSKSSSSPLLECELYVAESTIPNAGLGVFSAVEKKPGDTIGNGDVAFPALEIYFYNRHRGNVDDPFEDYQWDGATMGMGMEVEEGAKVETIWPGLDCVINSLIPLENVNRAFPRHNSHGDFLPYMPHRAKHPGAGSITPYRSATTLVKRDIPAGGELFKSYGDQWFRTRPWMFDQGFPLSKSFPHAQHLIDTYGNRFNFPPLYDLLLEIRDIFKTSRTLNALPSTMEELQIALEKDITQTYQRNATRDVEWLHEHGTCVDHIVPRPSTIDGAGEGAFAKRKLPKGTIITGSPLMIFPDEKLLFMDEVDPIHNGGQDSPSFTKQVIYNYCFGHEDSTLLLFPYGSIGVQYINHNPAHANVQLRWAENRKLRHNSTLLELTPDEIEEFVETPSLGIEYIATKDIMEGEELFIDYGGTWDAAWKRHAENWTPPEDDTIAADWNDNIDEPIRTQEEQLGNPYPKTIELRCHVSLLDPGWKLNDHDWKRYITGAEEYMDVYGVPCDCLDRSADNATYTVEIDSDHLTFKHVPDEVEYGIMGTRRGVPREAMFFLDATYESDLYLESAFRHHIRIPDHMMPTAWRNRDIAAQSQHQNEEL